MIHSIAVFLCALCNFVQLDRREEEKNVAKKNGRKTHTHTHARGDCRDRGLLLKNKEEEKEKKKRRWRRRMTEENHFDYQYHSNLNAFGIDLP